MSETRVDSKLWLRARSVVCAAVLLLAALNGRALGQTNDVLTLDPSASYEGYVAASKSAMMRAPGEAFIAAEQGYDAAQLLPVDQRTEALATALWLKAEASLRLGKPEQGLGHASAALELVGQREELPELRGNIILARGRLAGRLSDPSLAVTSFIEAHELFEKAQNPRRQSIALQALGSLHNDAHSYTTALEYFSRAADVFPGDDVLMLTNKNNVANILRETGDFEKARENFFEALSIAEALESPILVGRILSNIAELEDYAGRDEAAKVYLDAALKALDTEGGDEWARYARSTAANLALKAGDLVKAKLAVEEGFRGIDIETTNFSYTKLHEAASKVYAARGDWSEAFDHLEQFKRLEDEAGALAASSNLALISGRFQYQEQQTRLERLRMDQALQEAELLEAAQRQRQQQAIILAASVVVLIVVCLSVALFLQQRGVSLVNGKLRDTVDQLSNEIALRKDVEAALIEARDRAETADRMKSTFLATMSHELRTPMNGILGFTEVLLSGDLTDEQREQIEIIDQSSGSLLTLINDILDLSQLEAGKFRLRKSAFDLRITVENAVKLLRAKAQEKHLGLVVHIEPDVPLRAYGDEDRLRQILLNLVGNAVKFTDQGAVTLVVSKGVGDREIDFFVQDTGAGIPDDKIGQLFNRFSQVDGKDAPDDPGSGLGLAICKELVSAMDGDIGCSSVPGQGSIFRFCVPLADRRSTEQRDERPSLAVAVENRHFVVIDDVALRGDTLMNIMKSHGARADHFDDPDQAIAALRGAQADGWDVDAVFVSDCHNDNVAMSIRQRLEAEAGVPADRVVGFGVMECRAAQAFAATLENPITALALESALDGILGQQAVASSATAPAPSSAMRSGRVGILSEKTYADKVLIVDDVPANRKLVECILTQLGITTVTAENGQHAIEMASTETFGLILMDVYMPVMGGIEAASILRRQGLNRTTPIVALTATAASEDHGQAIAAGMQGVLTKPLNIQALKAMVGEALNGELSVDGERLGSDTHAG